MILNFLVTFMWLLETWTFLSTLLFISIQVLKTLNIGRCFLLISTQSIKISRNCNKMWHKRLEYIFVIFERLGWNLISLGTRPPRPFRTSMFMLQKYAPDHFCRQTLSWLIAGFYYPCLGAFWDTRGLKLPWSYQCWLKIANSCL